MLTVFGFLAIEPLAFLLKVECLGVPVAHPSEELPLFSVENGCIGIVLAVPRSYAMSKREVLTYNLLSIILTTREKRHTYAFRFTTTHTSVYELRSGAHIVV
jgi:hypothetical protein